MAAAIGLRMIMARPGCGRRGTGRTTGRKRAAAGCCGDYDGATRTEAAKIGGVGLQVVRDWVVKFNAQGPGGPIDRKAPGSLPFVTTRIAPRLSRSSRAL